MDGGGTYQYPGTIVNFLNSRRNHTLRVLQHSLGSHLEVVMHYCARRWALKVHRGRLLWAVRSTTSKGKCSIAMTLAAGQEALIDGKMHHGQCSVYPTAADRCDDADPAR